MNPKHNQFNQFGLLWYICLSDFLIGARVVINFISWLLVYTLTMFTLVFLYTCSLGLFDMKYANDFLKQGQLMITTNAEFVVYLKGIIAEQGKTIETLTQEIAELRKSVKVVPSPVVPEKEKKV